MNDIYDDGEIQISSSQGPDVEIDLSVGTLYQLCKPVREFLQDKPQDLDMTVYLVCGESISKDVHLFAQYLLSVSNPIRIVFRGIIHTDVLLVFSAADSVMVDKNSTYKVDVHNLMRMLVRLDSIIYDNFVKQFKQSPNQFDSKYIEVQELIDVGLNFSTF